MPTAPHAADGEQTARDGGGKREGITLTQIKEASATPGTKCRTQIGTEVYHHKNRSQRWPMKQRHGLGSNRDTARPLRKAVDEHKRIQAPVGRRLTEDEQHHKAGNRTTQRHTKSAFTMKMVHQP